MRTVAELTAEQREKLQEQLKALDAAAGKILAARKPFDEALAAVNAVHDGLLEEHGLEIADTCETCERLLFVGELGHSCTDGPTLCEACAPTWNDLKQQLDSDRSLGGYDESFESPEDAKDWADTVNAHIADGDGDKKNVWPL
jgi:hypothetical protein